MVDSKRLMKAIQIELKKARTSSLKEFEHKLLPTIIVGVGGNGISSNNYNRHHFYETNRRKKMLYILPSKKYCHHKELLVDFKDKIHPFVFSIHYEYKLSKNNRITYDAKEENPINWASLQNHNLLLNLNSILYIFDSIIILSVNHHTRKFAVFINIFIYYVSTLKT